ncbi:hypothetical protein E2C01_011946 [Portunus trituberculatus]|uniref:Uncharacterized protein n=1 Tax=Portunus trituberculatus TaxID=210409 RepID=A0A5B7DCI7_PORTR|nr:hypothetical protein [Portunus trituberculatus]
MTLRLCPQASFIHLFHDKHFIPHSYDSWCYSHESQPNNVSPASVAYIGSVTLQPFHRHPLPAHCQHSCTPQSTHTHPRSITGAKTFQNGHPSAACRARLMRLHCHCWPPRRPPPVPAGVSHHTSLLSHRMRDEFCHDVMRSEPSLRS